MGRVVLPVPVAVVILLGVAVLAGLAVRGWGWVRSRTRGEDPAVALAREHGLDEEELERTRTAVRRGRQVEPALRPAAVAWAEHVLEAERPWFVGASWRARGVTVVVFLGLHLVVLASLVLARGLGRFTGLGEQRLPVDPGGRLPRGGRPPAAAALARASRRAAQPRRGSMTACPAPHPRSG